MDRDCYKCLVMRPVSKQLKDYMLLKAVPERFTEPLDVVNILSNTTPAELRIDHLVILVAQGLCPRVCRSETRRHRLPTLLAGASSWRLTIRSTVSTR